MSGTATLTRTDVSGSAGSHRTKVRARPTRDPPSVASTEIPRGPQAAGARESPRSPAGTRSSTSARAPGASGAPSVTGRTVVPAVSVGPNAIHSASALRVKMRNRRTRRFARGSVISSSLRLWNVARTRSCPSGRSTSGVTAVTLTSTGSAPAASLDGDGEGDGVAVVKMSAVAGSAAPRDPTSRIHAASAPTSRPRSSALGRGRGVRQDGALMPR